MPIPHAVLPALQRIKKNAPAQRVLVLRLLGEARTARSEAMRADAKSAVSFWGRVKELSDRSAALRRLIEPTFDDAELLVRHRRDMPEAATLLGQVRQLAESLDSLSDALQDLVSSAKRISDKSALLAKVKLQSKDAKMESQFSKSFDAGLAAIGVLTIAIAVYKQLARKSAGVR